MHIWSVNLWYTISSSCLVVYSVALVVKRVDMIWLKTAFSSTKIPNDVLCDVCIKGKNKPVGVVIRCLLLRLMHLSSIGLCYPQISSWTNQYQIYIVSLNETTGACDRTNLQMTEYETDGLRTATWLPHLTSIASIFLDKLQK